MSLEELIQACDPHLIGLWRFRQVGRKAKWCTTFSFNGNYYDVDGAETPESALKKTIAKIKFLKSKEKGKKAKTTSTKRATRGKGR